VKEAVAATRAVCVPLCVCVRGSVCVVCVCVLGLVGSCWLASLWALVVARVVETSDLEAGVAVFAHVCSHHRRPSDVSIPTSTLATLGLHLSIEEKVPLFYLSVFLG
jgi:hypothetical protein